TAIADIKACCLSLRESFENIAGDTLLEIEYKPHVYLPLERPFWSEPVAATLELGNVFGELFATDADFDTVKGRPVLALWQLEERIDSLLQERTSFILPELVEAYPPEFALEELVGYLAIGMKASRHAVDRTDAIQIDEFSLPSITFCRSTQAIDRERKYAEITN